MNVQGEKKQEGRKKNPFSPVFYFFFSVSPRVYFQKESTFQTSREFLINPECGVITAFVLAGHRHLYSHILDSKDPSS